MKTNKFFHILLLSALTVPFTACDSDTDSNPVFHEPATFVLNESVYATNNAYDLGVANATVQLVCSQPDYGFPVATTYTVQVAFDNAFTEGSYATLGTTFTNTVMEVDASELNASLVELWGTVHEDEEVPTEAVGVYVRLQAVVTGQSIGNITSNTICLPAVRMSTSVTALELPEFMYLCGTMSAWSQWLKMAQVYGLSGQYYRVVYLEDGGALKFGTKENEWLGYSDSRLTITDNADAGISGDGDDNIYFDRGGWYLFTMKTAMAGSDYVFTLTVAPAHVYIIGECEGGNWSLMDAWKFTDSGDGALVSPPLAAAGEVRMCVDAGYDWWRTEFTLVNGTDIYYRDIDIASNWATDAGAEYAVMGTVGMVITLDFNAGTGSVK